MKIAIYIYSYHKGNTRKVAGAMAEVLGTEVVELSKQGGEAFDLSGYDLVGFGAGIAFSKHYKQLLQFATKLPEQSGRRAFIFSTAGLHSDKWMKKHHKRLREILSEKSFDIVGEFACKGHDSFSVLKLVGGINKGRPNEEDLEKAKKFAENLVKPV